MSAICGVVWREGRADPQKGEEAVKRMLAAMRDRGGDATSVVTARLGVLGAAGRSSGELPLASARGESVVAAVDGSVFADSSGSIDDAAVALLREWDRDDPRFPAGLSGEYSGAVLDDQRARALIVRDKVGIRPIYYADTGDAVIFASELKGVVASGFTEATIDEDAVVAYLTLGYVPSPHTLLAEVRKLRPGHRLVVQDDSVREERYWDYPVPDATAETGEHELVAELVELLRQAVRARAGRPPAVLLSGGIDSSLLAALLVQEGDLPVKTFSVGFAGAGEANELDRARDVAAELGTEHRELELSLDEMPVGLDGLVWALDEPVADLSAVGLINLSRLAAGEVTSALSGAGADGLLGGFPVHVRSGVASRFDRLPGPVRPLALAAARLGPARARRLAPMLGAHGDLARLLTHQAGRRDRLAGGLLREEVADQNADLARRAVEERLGSTTGDALQVYIYVDEQLSAVDSMLHYMDRCSGAAGLQLRVPFFDEQVVEFCATVPTSLKTKGLTPKYLLRRAAHGLVPPAVLSGPKVGFFNASVDTWVRRQLGSAVPDVLLQPGARVNDFLRREGVHRLADDVAAGRGDTSLLLAILFLEVWSSTTLRRARSLREVAG